MSRKTNKKTKKPKRAKLQWYHDWVKMPLALVLTGAVSMAIGLSCVRFAAGTSLNILGMLVASLGMICFIGAVGGAVWGIANALLLRRVTCPKCHARNKIPRRLTHYQCTECGRRVRL